MPAVSVAAYTSKGAEPHTSRISVAAWSLRTSDADITDCGATCSLPARCSAAKGLKTDGYPTSRRGWKSLSAATFSASGSVASNRSVVTTRERSDAPTTADWCVGTRELTIATRSGWVSPAGTPAQSLARA